MPLSGGNAHKRSLIQIFKDIASNALSKATHSAP